MEWLENAPNSTQGTLGWNSDGVFWPRGFKSKKWKQRWEGGSGWGTHVNPWLFHFNVWQNSLQIKKKKEKKIKYQRKKKRNGSSFWQTCWDARNIFFAPPEVLSLKFFLLPGDHAKGFIPQPAHHSCYYANSWERHTWGLIHHWHLSEMNWQVLSQKLVNRWLEHCYQCGNLSFR